MKLIRKDAYRVTDFPVRISKDVYHGSVGVCWSKTVTAHAPVLMGRYTPMGVVWIQQSVLEGFRPQLSCRFSCSHRQTLDNKKKEAHSQYFSPSYIHSPQLPSTRRPHISVMYGCTGRVPFVSPAESLAHPEKIFQRCLFHRHLAKPTLSSRRKETSKQKQTKSSHQSFKVGQETGSEESESTGRLHTELIDVILVRGGVVVEVVLWWRWDCLCGTAATMTTLG